MIGTQQELRDRARSRLVEVLEGISEAANAIDDMAGHDGPGPAGQWAMLKRLDAAHDAIWLIRRELGEQGAKA